MTVRHKQGHFTMVAGYAGDRFLIVGGDDDADYFHLTLTREMAQQMYDELGEWLSGRWAAARLRQMQ